MIIEARAKVNWTLDITGQRDDGYHLMEMLMQPITLCDRITLEEADTVTLTMTGGNGLPADETNLAYRAAIAMQKATGCTKGVSITLEKRIPSGAGLGGGSADAAGVLWGLNRLWSLYLSQDQLESIGLTLGADVPFCLRGGLGLVTGIGEVIRDLGHINRWPMVIVQPCEGLSTKEVFQAYHQAADLRRPDTTAAIEALASGDANRLESVRGNVLEIVSLPKRPAIGEAIEALHMLGAEVAAMSGSGSAVFGVFPTENDALKAASVLE